uniref:Growth-regulating factor n=1 Tax=Tanacetum cinerariifolium TaxID=118510 RepID=A0A6L2P350_TANCI|nr:growth-regulating factor 1 [Tanacetum cinerariifolium]
MMSSSLRNNDNSSRFPFTLTQWQELEHQALVYKYMISGMPIPHDLLFAITRSLDPPKYVVHHPAIGWNLFQMGYGKKIDPEPGRCRRTDGKKWRCSKPVHPEGKYCERHMHRGRNRSRKPVELVNTNSSSSSSRQQQQQSNVVSSQDHCFLLESSPYSEKDYSYGMKEEVDEHPLASMCDSWRIEPLAMNNSASSLAKTKQRSFSEYHNDYSYLQLQKTPTKQQQRQDQGRRYDHLALKIERIDEPQKVMHHFFDESPRNDNEDHCKDEDYSTTQLSISIPSCAHDFFLTHNDK